MPEKKSAAERLEILREEFQAMRERHRDLSYELRGQSDATIAEDESLSLAQAEYNELAEKIGSLESEMEQLEIIAPIEEKIEMIKALMPIGKFAIDGFKGEVAEILNELTKALVDLRESIDDQLARLSKINAKSRFRQFSDLQEAGFNESQAFMLTLASVHPINWSEMAQKSGNNVSASRSKRNS